MFQHPTWEQQAFLRYLSVAAYLAEEGWEESEAYAFETLNQGDVYAQEYRLRPGQYTAFAVCDDDCTDLDIGIVDEDENPIVVHAEPGALAVVEFEVYRRARIQVLTELVECSTSACVVGIGLYEAD